jgi:hypothetical protein
LVALDGLDPPRGGKLSRTLCEKVISACEAPGQPPQGPMLALLWRFAAEAEREYAREFAETAWRAPAPPLPLDRPSYAPLLIEAVAAALEAFEAPPVEVPALLESPFAPEIELIFAELEAETDGAPPVQLPAGMLAALAQAA